MNSNRILQRHNRCGGLCHNSPRLHAVIVRCCVYLGDCGGWWTPIHASRLGMMILRAMSIDPYDIYNKVYDGYTTHSRSYIRADIRFHLSLLQQLLFLLLVILLLCI